MKMALKLLIGLGIVVGVLVIALPQFVSIEKIWQEVREQVEAQTGRSLQAETTPKLTLFPILGLELQGLTFSNHADSKVLTMLSAQKVTLRLPWSSLWSGTVQVDEFILDKPILYLEKMPNGRGNWQVFEPAQPDKNIETEAKSVQLPDLKLGDIRLTDGQVTYKDLQTSTEQHLSNLTVKIAVESLASPLAIEGKADYLGKTHQLQAKLTHIAALLANEPVTFTLAAQNELVKLSLDARFHKRLEGSVSSKADSLKALLAWLGMESAVSPQVLKAFSLTSHFVLNGTELHLNELQAKLDDLTLKGQQHLTFGTQVTAKGKLELSSVDTNPYLGVSEKEIAENKATAPGWTTEAIDLSALNSFNLDQTLRLEGLKFQAMQIGQSQMKLYLNQGKARFELTELHAYQGQGQAQLELNAAAIPYKLSAQFALNGVQAQPLLNDAAGFDKLLGQGELKGELSTSGASQKAWVDGLSGQLSFRFTDGAIRGANIAAIIRSAQEALQGNFSGINLDRDFSHSEKTDFSELGASIRFYQGIGQSKDLMLNSPLIRVTGEGELDLPSQRLNYLVNARLVASIEGQGAAANAKGLLLPIRLQGPWSDVKIRPDLTVAAKETVKQKVEDKVKDKLKSLFGA